MKNLRSSNENISKTKKNGNLADPSLESRGPMEAKILRDQKCCLKLISPKIAKTAIPINTARSSEKSSFVKDQQDNNSEAFQIINVQKRIQIQHTCDTVMKKNQLKVDFFL